jgi:hypothetical protein
MRTVAVERKREMEVAEAVEEAHEEIHSHP